jgi:hypothetical protein
MAYPHLEGVAAVIRRVRVASEFDARHFEMVLVR